MIDLLRAGELQRLRRIRQLGLAHLVFPAAEHSRLAHVLGAAYIGIRFARRLNEASQEVVMSFLRPDEEARRDLAIGALCHDLGHGPLSHTFEREVIREDFSREPWLTALGLRDEPALRGLKWHELVGQGILAWPDGELHQLLEEQERGTAERVRQMLLGRYFLPYLPRLLSSDVDADRCDFLLRDAHQSGVEYGRFDLNWLISTADLGERPDGELVVAFDERKAPRVIEQFLVARRALYDTVYQHKTVKAAEGMVGLFLRRMRDLMEETDGAWPFEDSSLFAPYKKVMAGHALSPPEVLGLDDYSLWALIMSVAEQGKHDKTAADLARRIIARDLFKWVPTDARRLESFLGTRGREELYPVVQRHCPGDARYYVHVDYPDFETLSTDQAKEVYVVAREGDAVGRASVAREHPEIVPLFQPSEERQRRLFVPREAVEAVRNLLAR